jgi:ribosomal protein S13
MISTKNLRKKAPEISAVILALLCGGTLTSFVLPATGLTTDRSAIGLVQRDAAASENDKNTQCQKIITIHNQVVFKLKNLSDMSGSKGDISGIRKSAATFAQAAKKMKSLQVQDEKLLTFKNQFATMYQGSSDVTKQIALDLAKKRRLAVDKGLRKLRQVVGQETSLVNSVNSYCRNAGSST